MPNTQHLIGAKEAAAIARLDVRQIHRRVERGELKPALKLPGATGAYLFNRADVAALVKNGSEGPRS